MIKLLPFCFMQFILKHVFQYTCIKAFCSKISGPFSNLILFIYMQYSHKKATVVLSHGNKKFSSSS